MKDMVAELKTEYGTGTRIKLDNGTAGSKTNFFTNYNVFWIRTSGTDPKTK
jgi:hypothetical protein